MNLKFGFSLSLETMFRPNFKGSTFSKWKADYTDERVRHKILSFHLSVNKIIGKKGRKIEAERHIFP